MRFVAGGKKCGKGAEKEGDAWGAEKDVAFEEGVDPGP